MANFGEKVLNAIKGVLQGKYGIGGAVGGGIGDIGSSIGKMTDVDWQNVLDEVRGKPKFLEFGKFTPEQEDLQSLLNAKVFETLSPGFEGLLGSAAAKQFNEQTVPSIAERFTSLGVNPEGTSAFGQQLAQAQKGMLGQLLGNQQRLLPSLITGAQSPAFDILRQNRGGITQGLSQFGPLLGQGLSALAGMMI